MLVRLHLHRSLSTGYELGINRRPVKKEAPSAYHADGISVEQQVSHLLTGERPICLCLAKSVLMEEGHPKWLLFDGIIEDQV